MTGSILTGILARRWSIRAIPVWFAKAGAFWGKFTTPSNFLPAQPSSSCVAGRWRGPRREGSASRLKPDGWSGIRQCLPRVGTDAFDHGTKPVRTLRREVFAQSQTIEQGDRVGRQDLDGLLAGDGREQDGHEPPDDVSIAVATEGEHGLVVIETHGRCQPHLTGAALNLVRLGAVKPGQRVHAAAELDDVAISVVPFVQQSEVVDDVIDWRNISR